MRHRRRRLLGLLAAGLAVALPAAAGAGPHPAGRRPRHRRSPVDRRGGAQRRRRLSLRAGGRVLARRRPGLHRRPVQRRRAGVRARRRLPLPPRRRVPRGASPAGSASSAAWPTDRSGHLYVLDAENDRVQVFSAADGQCRWRASATPRSSTCRPTTPRSAPASAPAGWPSTSARRPSPPTVYVADQGSNRVARFTLDRATLTPSGGPTFSAPGLGLLRPQGIALDPAGTRVYVADNQNDRIAVLDPQSLGARRRRSPAAAAGRASSRRPTTSRSTRASRRSSTSPTTSTTASASTTPTASASSRHFGGFGRSPGLFSIVRAVGALSDDPQGGVAVADTAQQPHPRARARRQPRRGVGHRRAQRRLRHAPARRRVHAGRRGRDRRQLQPPRRADGSRRDVRRPARRWSATFTGYPSEGAAAGQFSLPAAVAFDAAGNTVVADTGNDRVVVLRAPTAASCARRRRGSLADPQSVVAGPQGSVIVADTGHDRIVTLAADGAVASQRTGLSHPAAVAWDRANQVFAADDTRVRDVIAGANVAAPGGAGAWDHPDGLAVDAGERDAVRRPSCGPARRTARACCAAPRTAPAVHLGHDRHRGRRRGRGHRARRPGPEPRRRHAARRRPRQQPRAALRRPRATRPRPPRGWRSSSTRSRAGRSPATRPGSTARPTARRGSARAARSRSRRRRCRARASRAGRARARGPAPPPPARSR